MYSSFPEFLLCSFVFLTILFVLPKFCTLCFRKTRFEISGFLSSLFNFQGANRSSPLPQRPLSKPSLADSSVIISNLSSLVNIFFLSFFALFAPFLQLIRALLGAGGTIKKANFTTVFSGIVPDRIAALAQPLPVYLVQRCCRRRRRLRDRGQ